MKNKKTKNKQEKKKTNKKTGKGITSQTKLIQVMEKNPKATEILFEQGMHCIGCSMSSGETLEQGCLAHGMSKKEIEELIKKLNK